MSNDHMMWIFIIGAFVALFILYVILFRLYHKLITHQMDLSSRTETAMHELSSAVREQTTFFAQKMLRDTEKGGR